MKAVLISIHPRHCENIASGKKTVEVRKTAPKIPTPFKCYIYETKDKSFEDISVCWNDGTPDFIHATGKVIGDFVCDRIYEIKNLGSSFMIDGDIALTNRIASKSCLFFGEMRSYLGRRNGCAWHISDLKIYDKPRELSEFRKPRDRFLDCFLCRRYKRDEFGGCDSKIHRPPQSYMFVEEI